MKDVLDRVQLIKGYKYLRNNIIVEPRYNDTNFSAIFLRYTEVSFNQGSRAGIINKEGPP
jgi:hypothetical protein